MAKFIALTDLGGKMALFNSDHIIGVIAPDAGVDGSLVALMGKDDTPAHVKESVSEIADILHAIGI